MQYKIIQMHFLTSVHFGQGNLHKSQNTAYADTLFSALCTEAVKKHPAALETLVGLVKGDRLRISDTMPYIGSHLYIPKPLVETEAEKQGDAVMRKAVRRLEYIPVDGLRAYLNGQMDIPAAESYFSNNFGKYSLQTKISISNGDTTPYTTGLFTYGADSGLYMIVGYESESDFAWFAQLMEGLSYSGIGGRIATGLGKFIIQIKKVPENFRKLLENGEGEGRKMTLSGALPTDEEMAAAMEGSLYRVIRRSGFVASENYAPEDRKKKDLYVFAAGSVFEHVFRGDVYDVSESGNHAVYRYAKPIFMEV